MRPFGKVCGGKGQTQNWKGKEPPENSLAWRLIEKIVEVIYGVRAGRIVHIEENVPDAQRGQSSQQIQDYGRVVCGQFHEHLTWK